MAAIEQQHPSQTRGTTQHTLPHTPAHGIAGLTHHYVEAQAAIRPVQAQSQEPEQHQDMVVPEDDEKSTKLGSNTGCRISDFSSLSLKNYLTRTHAKVLWCFVLYSFLYPVI